MLRDVLADPGALPESGASWREVLERYGNGLRTMLLGVRDGARVFSGTYLTDDSLLAAQEPVLRAPVDDGFTLRVAAVALHTTYSYVVGFTIEQQAVVPRPGSADPRYALEPRAARLHPHAHRLTLAAGPELFTGHDERFAAGLALIVAGAGASRGPEAGSKR